MKISSAILSTAVLATVILSPLGAQAKSCSIVAGDVRGSMVELKTKIKGCAQVTVYSHGDLVGIYNFARGWDITNATINFGDDTRIDLNSTGRALQSAFHNIGDNVEFSQELSGQNIISTASNKRDDVVIDLKLKGQWLRSDLRVE